MDNRLWQLVKKVKHRETAWLWGMVGMLAFISSLLALSVFALKHHVRVVMVPATFGEPLWVDDKTVSSRYVQDMAFFLSELYLNDTRETRATRLTVLLRHSAPESQGALKALFAKREADDKSHHDMAVQFSPTGIRVNGLTAFIEGELRTFWGQKEVARKRVIYQLTFRYHAGRLWLLTFTERDDKAR